MLTLFIKATVLIFILVTLLWIWSVIIKNVSIVDIKEFVGDGICGTNKTFPSDSVSL